MFAPACLETWQGYCRNVECPVHGYGHLGRLNAAHEATHEYHISPVLAARTNWGRDLQAAHGLETRRSSGVWAATVETTTSGCCDSRSLGHANVCHSSISAKTLTRQQRSPLTDIGGDDCINPVSSSQTLWPRLAILPPTNCASLNLKP